MSRTPHVVGLDLSLTGTGIAEVHPSGDVAHTLVTSKADQYEPTLVGRSLRLRTIAADVLQHASDADLVVIEAPSLGSGGRANPGTHDRAGLWWLIVASLTAAAVPVAEVSPGTLKVYATGKGRADKDVMVANVVRRWGHLAPQLANNNEVDAVVLASMGAERLGYPPVALPQDHTRALKAVAWPPTTTTKEK